MNIALTIAFPLFLLMGYEELINAYEFETSREGYGEKPSLYKWFLGR